MRAALPDNENDRLNCLHRLKILDTLPEQAYDDITFLAAELARTPIALISLIDRDRQWFKSRIGIDDQETSRDVSFCAHAILDPAGIFMVPDALEDKRFMDNPMVVNDPGIRFYAGAPLTTSGGFTLGTLCVIDKVPRQLDENEQARLLALSRMVTAQLELREALSHIKILHGLLPICASCKKIRNEDGGWQPVEHYVTERSEAKFSHGMCADCAEKLYPGLMDGSSDTSQKPGLT